MIRLKQTNSKRVLEQANSTKERESINREQFTGRKKIREKQNELRHVCILFKLFFK